MSFLTSSLTIQKGKSKHISVLPTFSNCNLDRKNERKILMSQEDHNGP